MGFYAVVLVACAVLFVASWRRSGRVMTRYVMYTGAPVVWLLLGLSAFAAATTELFVRDGETARGIFTGGLIGTAFVQVVLLRRRGLHEVGSQDVGSHEVGSQDVGSQDVGPQDVGSRHDGPHDTDDGR